MIDYIAIARPSHWVKNIFILPGVLAAMLFGFRPLPWLGLIGAFAGVCLVASANYVLNEWLDAASDAHHPLKNARPAVQGNVSRTGVCVEYVVLAIGGLGLGLACSVPMFWSLLALLLMGVLYNVPPIRLKDRPYTDVLSESVNNAIRLFIGWFVVTSHFLPPASLVIGYWMGGAFLMAVKRLAEYRMIADPERAALYRRSFAYYDVGRLASSILAYAMMASFFLGIFLVKYRVEFLLAMPVLWLLFGWYFNLGLKENSVAQRPEALWKQKGLLLVSGSVVVLLVLLMFVDVPALQHLTDAQLVTFGRIVAP